VLPKRRVLLVFCIATAMKANPHEIPIVNSARRLTNGRVSVIPMPIASSVMAFVTARHVMHAD